ncbi:MAG: hypothetical protein HFJ46_05670 [Clostridia bacterium]|nr:hypothetical protein [Clostridia bacterium]
MKKLFFNRNESLKKYDKALINEINKMLNDYLKRRILVPDNLEEKIDNLIVATQEKEEKEKKKIIKVKFINANKSKRWKRFIK